IPPPPLAPAQAQRLHEASGLWRSGQTDRGRKMLNALGAEVPHHPLILSELAQIDTTVRDYAALEKLGRAERAATHDSLLLGHELALASERLGHERDAGDVVVE